MIEETKLKLGETVCLNSGGPLMTIVEISDNVATCAWFNKEQRKKDTFPIEALKRSDGSPTKIEVHWATNDPEDRNL